MAHVHGRRRDIFKNRAICAGICIASIWILLTIAYFSLGLFPETEMVLFSNCNRPFQNWDGKIFDIPIWWSGFRARPPHFNLHNEKDLPDNFSGHYTHTNERTVVLWGTHHKTGTFLAKKLFAKVCARLKWCCLFHVTRDSVHAVRHSLHNEPVNALGHNQWIWHPNELNITNYRFIHFYRNPFRKIISGFRYHADGTEPWTQKPLTYSQICAHGQKLISSTSSTTQQQRQHQQQQHAERKDVFNFCESAHLCETCCRAAHEVPRAHPMPIEESMKRFRARSAEEYAFLCEQLGGVNRSMQASLLSLPEEQGVVLEAALEYYEILRMATLYNQTARDPHTLNVDLDDFTENFDNGTWRILKHLKDLIPSTQLQTLHTDLAFYDLEHSTLYRWSMSNPLVNHVTAHQEGGKTTKELLQVLAAHPQVMALYQPIFDLMQP